MFSNPWTPSFALILSYEIHIFLSTGICYLVFIFGNISFANLENWRVRATKYKYDDQNAYYKYYL